MEVLKVNELFSGIGAQRAALDRLHIPYEIVGISEIDKFAVSSYTAIHGKTRNYGDISKVDRLDYADLWTYSFPCTDISMAGKQAGMVKGKTRSGLLYEVERLLDVAVQEGTAPKYLLLENVRNLVGKNYISQFYAWLQHLEELGYNTYWQVMNSMDYGVPQNRERVFALSIRYDLDNTGFNFPEPIGCSVNICDMLETSVKECYYSNDDCDCIFESEGVKPTCVRRLTPREYWRFMGFTDGEYDKARYYTQEEATALQLKAEDSLVENGLFVKMSDTQMYRQAGNSIVVDVLMYLFATLFDVPIPHSDVQYNNGDCIFVRIVDDIYNSRDIRVYDNVCPTLRAERAGLKVVFYDKCC